MIQLEPQEKFTIARKLDDHTDTNTYFVQAVIRDAKTDDEIESVNLTDRGNRRFTKEWQVVADTSGLGRFITIETSVYTDSGYTTKSVKYGDEIHTYLIDRRHRPFGGSGGTTVEEVRQIVKAELDGTFSTFFDEERKRPKTENVVAEAKNELRRDLQRIVENMPEMPEQVDLKPVVSEIRSLSQRISNLESETKTVQKDVKDGNADLSKKVEKTVSEILSIKKDVTGAVREEARSSMKSVKDVLDGFTATMKRVVVDTIKDNATFKMEFGSGNLETSSTKRNSSIRRKFPEFRRR